MIPCVLRLLQGVGRLVQRVNQLDEEAGDALFNIYSCIFKYEQGVGGSGIGSKEESSAAITRDMSMGLRFCRLYLQQDSVVAAELKGYLSSMAKSPGQGGGIGLTASPGVFSSLVPSIIKLKSTAGILLFDLCTAIPKKLMTDICSEEVWALGRIETTAAADELDVLTYRRDDDRYFYHYLSLSLPFNLPHL